MHIDTHNHVMPTEALEVFQRDPSYGVRIDDDVWTGVHHVPFRIDASFYDADAKLAALDRMSIDAAVLSVSPTMFFYEADREAAATLCDASNAGMARMSARAPERFRWLANLPLQDPGLASKLYTEAAHGGCVGAAVGTSVAGERLDHPRFEEFWATADEIGRPVLVHPAFNEAHGALNDFYLQNVIGNPLETTLVAERLIAAGVLARHPGVRLLLLHGGGFFPYQAGRLQHARGCRSELATAPAETGEAIGQLYFDTIVHDPKALRFLVDWAPPGHVVLGTDMPFDMGPADPIGELRAALGDAGLAEIAGASPAALFAILEWQRADGGERIP